MAMPLTRQYPDTAPRWAESLPAMTEEQFLCWVRLLEQRTGMLLPRERRSFLVTSLILRMRQLGFESFEAYYEFVTCGLAGNVEWTALVDRLTVHETRFFRDPRAIRLLADHLIPELCQRDDRNGPLNIWSVGCSTGEEPYTLAMVADRVLAASFPGVRFGVTATDISLHSLATARIAVYPHRRCRDIPGEYASRYCKPLDGKRFRIIPALRRRVCCAQLNVLDVDDLPGRRMDLIYCQNLLIYFDRARRKSIVDSLVRHLRPGGVLILGAGEILRWTNPEMRRLENADDVLVFRREDQGACVS